MKAILLNKTFIGGWLDKDNNLAHEIIDFLLDDNGDHYLYNVPYGGIPSDIYIKGQEH